ncbi:hypothetical protein G9A89_017306 [Geosiphon pyriformis]|nr:hypothetical protein G9A89_017306 [Geosiphon pyriformis]
MDSGAVSDVCQSHGFSIICNNLLATDAACLSVYTDGSLSDLGTIDMKTGAASVYCACWEVGSGFQVMLNSLHADIDWFKFSMVWHANSHLAAGFTSIHTAGLCTYFMKVLYHWFLVAVCK